mmetsp:Transcript_63368/g.163029  ORF Transcript_63368/g.163029 Transcript_63368/m.163029 type:complete len:314 (-) Transcript_63368:1626-2567(-)
MSRIDCDAVRHHRVVDFLHDRPTRCLDTQNLLNLTHMVGSRLGGEHPRRAHHLPQTVALHEDLVADRVVLVILVDNRAACGPQPLHDSVRQRRLQGLQGEEQRLGAGAVHLPLRRPDAQLVLPVGFDIVCCKPDSLKILVIREGLLDITHGELQLELAEEFQVDLDGDVEAQHRLVYLLEVRADVTKRRPLDASLDNPRAHLAVLFHQGTRDDRRRNCLGCIDDLLDPGHAQSDVHAGHTSEVERLQCHLGCRLTDRLRRDSSNGLSRHEHGLHILRSTPVHEGLELLLCGAAAKVRKREGICFLIRCLGGCR